MTTYEHVSWCEGTHTMYAECTIERHLQREYIDDLVVTLLAIPCDTARMDVSDGVYDADQAEWLAAALLELCPLLEAGRAEAACEGHTHDEDEDEDEDEDCQLVCSSCDLPKLEVLHVGDGQTWCRSCCAAAGIQFPPGRHG